MQRVSVVGAPGSGKTTFGASLAQALTIPHVELDAIFHGPGWTEPPNEEFRAKVAAIAETPSWVIDGNYGERVQDLVWACADTVVWLDLPRSVVMRRIVTRTLGRIISRRELWNGNRERWENFFSLDPYESVIVWSWTRYGHYLERYGGAARDPACSHITFHRIGSSIEADNFLRSLPLRRV